MDVRIKYGIIIKGKVYIVVDIILSIMKEFKPKQPEIALIKGMLNNEWQEYMQIIKKGKFKSQPNNFSKYISPLIKSKIAEQKWYHYRDKKNRQMKKKHYKLNSDKFCNIFIIFYEQGEFETFNKSEYTKKYSKEYVADYNLIIQDVCQIEKEARIKGTPEKVISWLKSELKNNQIKYQTPEHPFLFYQYCKNPEKFKEVMQSFVRQLKKEGVEPEHFKQLLILGTNLSKNYQDSISGNGEPDIKQLMKDYTQLFHPYLFDFITNKKNDWLRLEVKFIINNFFEVSAYLDQHKEDFKEFRKKRKEETREKFRLERIEEVKKMEASKKSSNP